jgi:hypothetical protein
VDKEPSQEFRLLGSKTLPNEACERDDYPSKLQRLVERPNVQLAGALGASGDRTRVGESRELHRIDEGKERGKLTRSRRCEYRSQRSPQPATPHAGDQHMGVGGVGQEGWHVVADGIPTQLVIQQEAGALADA